MIAPLCHSLMKPPRDPERLCRSPCGFDCVVPDTIGVILSAVELRSSTEQSEVESRHNSTQDDSGAGTLRCGGQGVVAYPCRRGGAPPVCRS